MLRKMLIKKRFLVYQFSRRNYLLKFCGLICLFVLIYINLSQFILNNGDAQLLRSYDSNDNEFDINDPSRLFVNKISKERLNNLFRVLQHAEDRFFSSGQNTQQSSLDNQLNLLSFNRIRQIKLRKKQDLLNSNNSDVKLDSAKSRSTDLYERFENEIDTFLTLEDNDRYLQATDQFVQYLENKSKNYSYLNNNPKVVGKTLHKDKIRETVILMAANFKYYSPLKESIKFIREYFPDLKIIIYDLGLSEFMIDEITELCGCQFKTYDPNGIYAKLSPHLSDLVTYSWKPLIIQETLSQHERVIYIDTSIKFNSSHIDHIIRKVDDVGIQARYIELTLPCFTDNRMFQWFNEHSRNFKQVYSLEANFIIFSKSFLTSLIMKSWVSCALDQKCIAPSGSHIYGTFKLKSIIRGCTATCECHRFDQDALAIVNTYFYGFPREFNRKPAFAFNPNEEIFYNLVRRNIPKYIKDQVYSFTLIFFDSIYRLL